MIQIWLIIIIIQYAIIYLIMVVKFQNNGKMINIKIHKSIKMDLLRLWFKHITKRYLKKNIIMIL